MPQAFEADNRLPHTHTPTNVASTVFTPPLTVFGNPGFGPFWMHVAIQVYETNKSHAINYLDQQVSPWCKSLDRAVAC